MIAGATRLKACARSTPIVLRDWLPAQPWNNAGVSAQTAYLYTLSPQRIIIGGGVGSHAGLLKMVREKTRAFVNGYIPAHAILKDIDSYIVPPALGDRAGVLGAIALAKEAWEKST